ncbi:MAG: DMT family transporter [Candidatus Levybacteria bacterium]|nr:DMT family transporter [Candidatus Levybacteria bacterium]
MILEQWFLLALLAPALFALVNIIDDNLLRNVYRSAHFGAIISGLFGLLPLTALFFVDISVPNPIVASLGLLAGFLTVMYYYFYFRGLEVEKPSVVISLFSLAPALIPFLAYFFLKEVLTLNQYLGFGIILFSSLLISATDIKKFKFSPALLLIGFGALIFAIISVIGKYVYTEVDFWTGYMLFSMGMGLGALFLLFTKKGRDFGKEFKKTFKKWILVFIAVELLGISAEFVGNLAISRGPVSIVKVVEGIQPIYVLVFAVLLFPFFPKYFRDAAGENKLRNGILMLVMIVGLFLVYKS